MWNVRSFPKGLGNCDYIIHQGGNKYLIRGMFMYRNYDGQGRVLEFDLCIEANMWVSVQLGEPNANHIQGRYTFPITTLHQHLSCEQGL